MESWDDRGQSIQIGAVLLFAALILLLSLYQATIVPQQNEQIEFGHSQQVQGELLDLRNAVTSMFGESASRSVSIQLGTTYPSRVLAVNPPPVSGLLRTTGTADSEVSFELSNVKALAEETDDFWDGAVEPYSTGSVVYRPNYNEYGQPPQTVYDSTVLYDNFTFEGATIARSDQTLVDGSTISLVALNGSLQRSSSGPVSVDVRPVSASSTTIAVTNRNAGPITIRTATRLPKSTWDELLADESNVTDVRTYALAVDGFRTLEVDLRPGTYQLRMAKAGVGTRVTDTDPAYMTDVAADGSTVPEDGSVQLIVEVRDTYNNPVSGVSVQGASADSSVGELESTTATTGDDGRATFRFDAKSVSAETDTVVKFSYAVAPGPTGFDPTTPENVDATVTVQDTSVSRGSGGGGAPFSVAWSSPNGGTNDRYTFDVSTQGNTLDMTAVVENTSLTNVTIDGVDADFAVNDRTVGTVFPGNDTSGPSGTVSTTLTAQDNGVVRVYVVTGGGASDYIDVEITGATIPQPGVVFAGVSNGGLSTIDTSGTIGRAQYGVTGVKAAGPQSIDFAWGPGSDVPAIDGNGDLVLTDLSGNNRTLVNSNTYNPGLSDSRLAVGRVSVDNNNDYLTGQGPYVYFINGNGDIARVDANGNIALVDGGIGAQAVAGTGDIDGDGTPELVYVDSNGQFDYLNDKTQNGKAERLNLGSSPVLNTPNAVGQPADFDGDGADEIPFIDGNSKVKYVNGDDGTDTEGSVTTVTSGAGGEYPVGAADRDTDGLPEIVYVDTSGNQRLAYADPTDGTVFITDTNGNEVAAKSSPGAS